eukprot:946555-Pelagomonas_calceolata.AAC.3
MAAVWMRKVCCCGACPHPAQILLGSSIHVSQDHCALRDQLWRGPARSGRVSKAITDGSRNLSGRRNR